MCIRAEPTSARARSILWERSRIGGQHEWALHCRTEAVAAGDKLKEGGIIKEHALCGQSVRASLKRGSFIAKLRQARIHLNHADQISPKLHDEERHDQGLADKDQGAARGAGASTNQGPHDSSFRVPLIGVKQRRCEG